MLGSRATWSPHGRRSGACSWTRRSSAHSEARGGIDMVSWMRVGLLALAIAGTMAGPTRAAESAATLKDLTAVIALQGLPCGQVVSAARQGENDYLAACKDGNRYHVYTTAQGRVVVQKQ